MGHLAPRLAQSQPSVLCHGLDPTGCLAQAHRVGPLLKAQEVLQGPSPQQGHLDRSQRHRRLHARHLSRERIADRTGTEEGKSSHTGLELIMSSQPAHEGQRVCITLGR